MKLKLTFVFLLSFSFAIVFGQGKVGINTTSPLAMLHVKDSSVIFTGALNISGFPGNPPVSGVGIRMMWYPDKAAFRAGGVSGTEWNKDTIGAYSIALGKNIKAKGFAAIAMGYQTIASGNYSTALGNGTIASNALATSMGFSTTASGYGATAL